MTLKASIELGSSPQLRDPQFLAAPEELQIQYLNSEVLPSIDPEFKAAPEPDRIEYIKQEILPKLKVPQLKQSKVDVGAIMGDVVRPNAPNVSPYKGLQNIAGSVGQGLSNFGAAAVNPGTYQKLGEDALNAVATEFKTRSMPPQGRLLENLFMSTPTGLLPGAVQGARDLAQGVVNLPSDIANAYSGRQTYEAPFKLPEVDPGLRARYPVSSFVGEQLPYGLPITRAAKAVKPVNSLRSVAEGALISGAVDPKGQGLSGRVTNASVGAVLPAGIGTASKLLKGRVTMPSTAIERPIGIKRVREAVTGNGQRSLNNYRNEAANGPASRSSAQPSEVLGLEDTMPDRERIPGRDVQSAAKEGSSEKNALKAGAKEKEIRETIEAFGRSELDSEKLVVAEKLYSMAQGVDRELFTRALKDTPQETINAFGRLVGC